MIEPPDPTASPWSPMPPRRGLPRRVVSVWTPAARRRRRRGARAWNRHAGRQHGDDGSALSHRGCAGF
ncbi:N-acetylglucosamine-6-phosphate deacetylase domain protein [Mycobacterium xenopi 3993]|nr:N-acetylglucosamine-6-phosphate deacetylase domain protein [Mycobacterium xenopi 3993]